MAIIALCNQKGGVGKSTTTFHLARAAARFGVRCLVIDMDPQGNISSALSKEPLREDFPGVADALSARSPETLASVIVPSIWELVDLAPTVGEALSVVRDELVVAGAGREGRLRQQIAEVNNAYGLVLIDCPPSLDQLTINALSASERMVIVSQSKQWSSNGLAHLLGTIRAVKAYYNPGLMVRGIVVNQHEGSTKAGNHWLDELHSAAIHTGTRLLEPVVPKRVTIADAVEASMGLDEYPNAPRDLLGIYDLLFQEVTA